MEKTKENDLELEHYKAVVRRQELDRQTRHQNVLHSDRAAVDLGLTALQTAILINGGAVVAILAFVGQLWGRDTKILNAVLHSAAWFVYGIISAVAAAFVAYLYASFVTAEEQYWLRKVSDSHVERSVWFWPRVIASVIMIGLVLASYGFFVRGAFEAMATMAR
jgi:hypothetical protein